MESTMVIKVNYGDTLRRFNAHVNENEELDLDMNGLRAKILGLFNLPPDADLNLTYIDEDGDIVTLVDDDDLRDVMRQRLKFLRIIVQQNNEKYGKSNARSSGSSTPLRTPRSLPETPNINPGVAAVLKSVPEPLREAISKLSLDLASKAASSNTVVADFVDVFTKTLLNPVAQAPSDPKSRVQSGAAGNVAPSVPADSSLSNDCNVQEVLLKFNTAIKTTKEEDIGNVSKGATVPVAPVDLNLDPPCDSNQSGCTILNSAPAVSTVPVVHNRKDAKESYGASSGKTGAGVSTSCAAPVRPSDQYMPCMPPPESRCPFSGLPLTNGLPIPSLPYGVNPFKRSCSRSDALGGIFHRGVRCDGCGVHPITGPRYKSKVKEDYDLCSICFSEMGNEADYIRIDRPISFRQSRSFRAHDHHPWAPPPALPHHVKRLLKPFCPKLDSRFILDVNVLDGTMMAPSTPFTKIWRMRNNGNVAWPQGVQLVWMGGDNFSDSVLAEIKIPEGGVPVDGELDVAVDFTAPAMPGRYISYWRLASPTGVKFGQRVWVLIQVDASLKESLCDDFKGLNLNLPPAGSGSKGPETIDVNVMPEVDGGLVEPCNISMQTDEPAKPMFDEPPKKDQELTFPINDGLLVGHTISASAPPASSSSVSYPIIDLSDAIPAEPFHTPSPDNVAPSSSEGPSDKEIVEQSLLKELEEMGFKQVDLNKEILRMNDYNLEQSVDDLCGVTEWDPILEELMEMKQTKNC